VIIFNKHFDNNVCDDDSRCVGDCDDIIYIVVPHSSIIIMTTLTLRPNTNIS